MVLAAAVAIGVDAAWIVVLPVGIGLGAVWASRRRGVRDGLAHEPIENELRLHIRELRDSRARLGQVAMPNAAASNLICMTDANSI
jgi:hypothetical protein